MNREKFIKMNKPARAKWLAKKGFSSQEEFLSSLIPAKAANIEKKESLDLIIAFDTTGSMDMYREQVKQHIVTVVKENFTLNPNLRIGIVAFGDYCDMNSATDFGIAYQYLPLTNEVNSIVSFVNNAMRTIGGDEDEFYELVIKKITEEVNWNENSNKVVLLIADYNPHPVGYSYENIVKNAQIDWKEEAKKAASRGIKFNTLAILPKYTWYKELSEITNGTYLPFKSAKKTPQLITATLLAEGGEKTKGLFDLKLSSEKDKEMKEVYKTYSLKLT